MGCTRIADLRRKIAPPAVAINTWKREDRLQAEAVGRSLIALSRVAADHKIQHAANVKCILDRDRLQWTMAATRAYRAARKAERDVT